ncbi:NUDIX hydrolase [Mucilaginibacter agri]|uniref:NUDIX domain-containing protein n=1 Tax=Mucilaginibacter agri TaxID=2695265 RepID=A0A966DSA2_9SPHI|nr:NUDIX domain-containing protein [Mucilaginibacter agri]NCD69923.1 NUDIX domain-containing protein [Mucilaginibacter agri]
MAEFPDNNQATADLKTIDKIAFVYIKDRKILSTRSNGKSVWYIPGGKREPGENDMETLSRELKEELNIEVSFPEVRYIGVFKAQAHGHPDGTVVKMTCYTGAYTGELKASAEIDEFDFFTLEDQYKSAAVDRLILQFLHEAGMID